MADSVVKKLPDKEHNPHSNNYLATEGALSNIFISYSLADNEFVHDLHERLRKSNRVAWSDRKNAGAQKEPKEESFSRIEAAEFFIFIISPDSLASPDTMQELAHAVEHHKHVVCVLRREVETNSLPREIAGLARIPFRREDDFEQGFRVLLQQINTDLNLSVFISYSRKDRDFVKWLDEELKKKGRRTWLDQKNIPFTEKWLNAIYSGIEAADNFIFVISPDSLTSKACAEELAHAVKHNKRLIPLLRREVDSNLASPALRERNWLPFVEANNVDSFQLLLDTMDTDLDYVHAHTRLLTHAIEWKNNRRDRSLLLRGRELRAATKFLAQAASRKPHSTDLQKDYVSASSRAARIRILLMLSVTIISISVISIIALRAWSQQKINESRKLAASATSYLISDPEFSLRLAIASAEAAHTEQAEEALREALINAPVHEMQGPERGNLEAVFSPDNKLLLITSMDKSAQVFEVSSGRRVFTLEGHSDTINAASFSFDSRRIVTASADHTARIWDSNDGRSLFELKGHGDAVNSALFSSDGAFIVTASDDNTARVWDASTGRNLFEIHGREAEHGEASFMRGANFSPDGRLIATVSYSYTPQVWDAHTGRRLYELKGHTRVVFTAAFSPDSRFIVTASFDGTAKVWDASNGRKLVELTAHKKPVNQASFSHDGKFIVTASDDDTARIWDANNGRSLYELKGHTSSVESASFSRDNKYVLTWSFDHTARLWDVASQRTLSTWGNSGDPIATASFSPDNALILTLSKSGKARTWDVSLWKSQLEFRGQEGFVTDVAFSPDGNFIVTTGAYDNTARVWDARSGQRRFELKGHTNLVNTAAFSPDGKFIVTTSIDRTARTWDASDGHPLLELRGHEDSLTSAVFSPDGKLVATASRDKTARIWDASSGRNLLQLHEDNSIDSVEFSPDGKLIVTSNGSNLAHIWDAGSGRNLIELVGHGDIVNMAAFSRDAKLIVTASDDHTARVWDASSGRELIQLRGDDAVHSAVFSSDSKLILTASGYNSIVTDHPPEHGNVARLWAAESGRLLLELRGYGDQVTKAVFSPDGKLIATSSWDRAARIYSCLVCAPFNDLLSIARSRVTQTLTPEERARVLGEQPSR